jgi:hypothetical protein
VSPIAFAEHLERKRRLAVEDPFGLLDGRLPEEVWAGDSRSLSLDTRNISALLGPPGLSTLEERQAGKIEAVLGEAVAAELGLAVVHDPPKALRSFARAVQKVVAVVWDEGLQAHVDRTTLRTPEGKAGTGPWERRVTLTWRFRQDVRKRTWCRPWSPLPPKRNRHEDTCKTCGASVAKKAGYWAKDTKTECCGCADKRLHWLRAARQRAKASQRRKKGRSSRWDPKLRGGASRKAAVRVLGGMKQLDEWQAEEQAAWKAKRPMDATTARRLASTKREAANRTLGGRFALADRVDLTQKVQSCRSTWVTATCMDCGTNGTSRPKWVCDERLCSHCAHARASRNARRVAKIVGQLGLGNDPYSLSMITLTIKNVEDLRKETWSSLRYAFNRFVALVELVQPGALKGGARFFETTWSSTGEWHPHVHALIQADYIDQALASDLWLVASEGCGFVVDVRRVKKKDRGRGGDDPQQDLVDACLEVSKYASKALAVDDPQQLLVLREAIKGSRLMEVFGTWRDLDEDEEEEDELVQECPDCGAEDSLVDGPTVWRFGLAKVEALARAGAIYSRAGRGKRAPPRPPPPRPPPPRPPPS